MTTAERRSRAVGRRALVSGLLVVALYAPATSEPLALKPLLDALDLRGYPRATLAPEFSGQALDGRQLALAGLRGKVVIVNFWASWCVECRREMPALERLHRDLASRGLAVVGINAREARETVSRYGTDLELSFPLVLDPTGTIGTVYGVIALPTTFVLGRDGRAVALGVGPREWASAPARSIIQLLLDESSTSRPDRSSP